MSKLLLATRDAELRRTLELDDGWIVENVGDGDLDEFYLTDWIHPEGLNYGAVLLDFDLDGIGLRCCRDIRRNKDTIPVFGVISRERFTPEKRIEFLDNGGDGLFPKIVTPRELRSLVGAALRRSGTNAESILTYQTQGGPLKVNQAAGWITLNGSNLHLSGKERDILMLLAANVGKVMSKERLLQLLYSEQDEPEVKIIGVFICKLRNRLNATSKGSGSLIQTVWGRGYRMGDGKDLTEGAYDNAAIL